jgi:hypothetical protein
MKAIKNIGLLFLFSGSALVLRAQQPGLQAGEVDVVKSFEARLGEAERFRVAPVLPPLDTAARRLDYYITGNQMEVDYLPPRIRPLAMPSRADKSDIYNGYLRLGGGFPGAILGDGYYNLSTIENFDLGLTARHHSANNDRRIENQRFSYTGFGVDGTYHFDQGFAVNGGLGYSTDMVHFYGYNDLNEKQELDLTFLPEEVRQRFNTFDAKASIFNSTRTEADFNYHAGAKLYLLNDFYAARERGFNLLFSGTKWFGGSNPLNIELETDFTTYRDTADQNLNNFFLRPNYTYHGSVFTAKVGVNIASHRDQFSFFPDLELYALLVDGVLGAYVGATGTLQKNDFRTLSEYNPFISSRIRVRNSSYYQYYGGVKGNWQGINFDAQVGYKTVDNLALFLMPDALDTIPRFDVLYDTANIFYFKASLEMPLFEGFNLTGTVSQNFFSLRGQEKPWHLPSFTVNVGARYTTLEDKLTLKGDFFLENGVPYLDENNEAKNLNALFDVSLGADYFFSKKIGGFIQINNLANNQRQRWFRYPIFGINAMAGIVVRF